MQINLFQNVLKLAIPALFSLALAACSQSGSTNSTNNGNRLSAATSSRATPSEDATYLYAVDDATQSIYMYQTDARGKLQSLPAVSIAIHGTANGITVAPNQRFVYVPTEEDSISCYAIDQQSGELSLSAKVSTNHPIAVAVDKNSQYAYVTNFDDSSITVFKIDQNSGVLTTCGDSVLSINTLPYPSALSINSFNNILTVAHELDSSRAVNLDGFKIQADGSLLPLAAKQTPAIDTTILAGSSDGNWLFGNSLSSANSLASFQSYSQELIPSGVSGPIDNLSSMLVIDGADNKYLYATDMDIVGKIWQYKIDNVTGALSALESPSIIIGDYSPADMLTTEDTRQIYVASSYWPKNTLAGNYYTLYQLSPNGSLIAEESMTNLAMPNMNSSQHEVRFLASATPLSRPKLLSGHTIASNGVAEIAMPHGEVDITATETEYSRKATASVDKLFDEELEDRDRERVLSSTPNPSLPQVKTVGVTPLWNKGDNFAYPIAIATDGLTDGQLVLSVKGSTSDGQPNQMKAALKVSSDILSINKNLLQPHGGTLVLTSTEKIVPSSVNNSNYTAVDTNNNSISVPVEAIISGNGKVVLSFGDLQGDELITLWARSETIDKDGVTHQHIQKFPIRVGPEEVNEPVIVYPYELTNVSLNSQIIAEFPADAGDIEVTVTAGGAGGGIPGKSSITTTPSQNKKTVTWTPGEALPPNTNIAANLKASSGLMLVAALRTVEHDDDNHLIIYTATNNGAGFLGNLGGVNGADWICNHDPAKPNDQSPPTHDGSIRPPRIFKAILGAQGVQKRRDEEGAKMKYRRPGRYPCSKTRSNAYICSGEGQYDWVLYPHQEYYKINAANEYQLISTTNDVSVFGPQDLYSTIGTQAITAWTGLNLSRLGTHGVWYAEQNHLSCGSWYSNEYAQNGVVGYIDNITVQQAFAAAYTECNTSRAIYCAQQ